MLGEVPLDRVVGRSTVTTSELEEDDAHASLERALSDALIWPNPESRSGPGRSPATQEFQWIVLTNPVGSPPLKIVCGFTCPYPF